MKRELTAAVSFRSTKEIALRYNKFLGKMTIGFECEIAANPEYLERIYVNTDAMRRDIEENLTYTETDYLVNAYSFKSPEVLVEEYEIKPRYGFASDIALGLNDLLEDIIDIGFKVIGQTMSDGSLYYREPGQSYERSELDDLVRDPIMVPNGELAVNKADDIVVKIEKAFKKLKISEEKNNYFASFIDGRLDIIKENMDRVSSYLDAITYKNPDQEQMDKLTEFMKSRLFQMGRAINQTRNKLSTTATLAEREADSHKWLVYDKDRNLVTINLLSYNVDDGLLNDLIQFDADLFRENYLQAREDEIDRRLEVSLGDGDGDEDDEHSANAYKKSQVLQDIHGLIRDKVDSKATLLRDYHEPSSKRGKATIVEPDSSIKPAGAEVVSQVFKGLKPGFDWLESVFDTIENNKGLETNNSTGLHVNIGTFRPLWLPGGKSSYPKIDIVKLVVLSGDAYLLEQFGRQGNTYAEVLSDIIKKLGREFDFTQLDKRDAQFFADLNKYLYTILKNIPHKEGRYRTINMLHLVEKGYLEFRIAGGENYHADKQKVKKAVYRYAQLCAIACDPKAYAQDYLKRLYQIFVGSTKPGPTLAGKPTNLPATPLEAVQYLNNWNKENSVGLDVGDVGRIMMPIKRGQDIYAEEVLETFDRINKGRYNTVNSSVLYAIRLLLLYSFKEKANPKQSLLQNKDRLLPSTPYLSKNKPKWVEYLFTGKTGLKPEPLLVTASTRFRRRRFGKTLSKNPYRQFVATAR